MNKTLLDEFAMAALSAILVKSNYSPSDQAAEAYRYAEAMLVEHEKRFPAPVLIQAVPEDLRYPGGAAVDVERDLLPADNFMMLSAIQRLKGRRMTCSGLYREAYGRDGDVDDLRNVGAFLRSKGFKRTRSGGKDYYQL